MDTLRRETAKDIDDHQTLRDLTRLSANTLTCNKYKHKVGKRITPGLFTFFCLQCGVCVGFELFDAVESPGRAFLTFALRAWTAADFAVLHEWENNHIWKDVLCHLPESLSLGPEDEDDSDSIEDLTEDPCQSQDTF